MDERAILHCLQTLEVDGVGPGLVKKVVEGGLKTMSALWEATPQTLAGLVGAGRGPALHTALRTRWATVSVGTRLIASNLLPRGVGEKKLRALFTVESDPRQWATAFSKGRTVEGWSQDSLAELLRTLPAVFAWEESFGPVAPAPAAAAPAAAAPAAAAPAKGHVVFSGVRDKELAAALVANGWILDESITKTTTLLIVADEPGADSVKVKKARAAGVRIVGLTAARLLR
jgi:NAD-dependent DNA ligase